MTIIVISYTNDKISYIKTKRLLEGFENKKKVSLLVEIDDFDFKKIIEKLESLGNKILLVQNGTDKMLENPTPDKMLENPTPDKMLENPTPDKMLENPTPDKINPGAAEIQNSKLKKRGLLNYF